MRRGRGYWSFVESATNANLVDVGERQKMQSSSKKKNALFAAITVVGALIFMEIFASWALMLRMRVT